MPIGQTLRAPTSATEVTYFSPWFSRGGNKCTLTCDVIASDGLTHFKIAVQTKNSEQSDKDQSTFVPQSGGATTMTLTTNSQTRWQVGANLDSANNGFLELVRFKYQVKADSGKHGWVHFRMLDPQWLTN